MASTTRNPKSLELLNLMEKQDWTTVADLVELLDKEDFFDEEFEKNSVLKSKRDYVRRTMRSFKHQDGYPLFASVIRTSDDGVKERVYKHDDQFTVDDYKQVVAYHADLVVHHRETAKRYVDRCRKRHKVKIRLRFGDEDVKQAG